MVVGKQVEMLGKVVKRLLLALLHMPLLTLLMLMDGLVLLLLLMVLLVLLVLLLKDMKLVGLRDIHLLLVDNKPTPPKEMNSNFQKERNENEFQ